VDKAGIALIFALATAGCSGADIREPDWKFVSDGSNGSRFCFDANSIDSDLFSGKRRAWVRIFEPQEGRAYSEKLQFSDFDCRSNTVTQISWIRRYAGGGSNSGTVEEKERIAEPVSPESVYSSVINSICRQSTAAERACTRPDDESSRDLLEELERYAQSEATGEATDSSETIGPWLKYQDGSSVARE